MKLLCLLWMTTMAFASAPEGIPREFAKHRALRVSDVHYRLHFELAEHADSARGQEILTFNSSDANPIWLDFSEGTIHALKLNGNSIEGQNENGHILLNQVLKGLNRAEIDFTVAVGPSGKAITRYEDKDDGSEYIYTLFVPMDASMAFPCFDQPDIKGRFTLNLDHPAGWQVISNVDPGHETEPISTYLFAFAAGPFERVNPRPNVPNVFVRKSQVARAQEEVPQIQSLVLEGTHYLARYFAQPFPFPKYDMVLIPGFPFGGMEHAGATFLNEDSMLFRSAPTETDRFGRNITVLHELTHQWFGDFTTMRWFDDLWLKEGFAQYMAYHAMADLEPGLNVWARFYQQIKPPAYRIDITQGTTPIYQEVPNLKDAKSAYGAIVYSKAPGLLRQLEFLIGSEAFRDGLRFYLARHRYGNAQWSDLVHAFEVSSRKNLQVWAEAWIQHRGMPLVSTEWSCADGQVQSLTLYQSDILSEHRLWPIATEVLLAYPNGASVKLRAQFDTATYVINRAAGQACPAYVFANNDDHAYGLFLLDQRSQSQVLERIAYEDLFTRTLLWGALYDAMHLAELDPHRYVEAALSQLPSESDELLIRSISARTILALHDYIDEAAMTNEFETLAYRRMNDAATVGERILWFRSFVSAAQSEESRGALRELLRGKEKVPGVEFRALDRWRMVTALLATSDSEGLPLFEEEKARDTSGIGQKYAYVAIAARPSIANKSFYFEDYLRNPSRPEDWVQDSLAAFNYWNQSEVTLRFLTPALNALPQIKQERKIFFLIAWLEAFIGGQHSREASREVHAWLEHASLEPDLRLKVLQVLDDLDRTIQIRIKYMGANG